MGCKTRGFDSLLGCHGYLSGCLDVSYEGSYDVM